MSEERPTLYRAELPAGTAFTADGELIEAVLVTLWPAGDGPLGEVALRAHDRWGMPAPLVEAP